VVSNDIAVVCVFNGKTISNLTGRYIYLSYLQLLKHLLSVMVKTCLIIANKVYQYDTIRLFLDGTISCCTETTPSYVII